VNLKVAIIAVLLLSVFCISIVGQTIASPGSNAVGVSVGDKFTYTIKVSWKSNGGTPSPSPLADFN
jgi:hypothetical protein